MHTGKVYAHVGQTFEAESYDIIIIGAGRMGSLTAHFMMQQRPDLRLLLLDQGGLPNEEGATILAAGIWSSLDVPPERLEQAQWTRSLLLGQLSAEEGGLGVSGPNDAPTVQRGLLELFSEETAGSVKLSSLPDVPQLPEGLLDAAHLPYARFDSQALTYSPASLTTRAAQSAVRGGADLMLNAVAEPTPSGALLSRLSITNTHQIIVHQRHQVSAQHVIIAAGAAGPHLAEQALGSVTHHAQAYRQVPRLNWPSSSSTPVIRAAGLTLRPHASGFSVMVPVHHRDPHGYLPTAGRLSGVPTGLRRETLEDLLLAMDAVPALGTAALEVGRSLSDVAGAWLALPKGGWPLFKPLTERHWLLLGGEKADVVGAWLARALALRLAQTA